MKIFMNASLNGRKEFLANYTELRDAIEKAGHKIIAAPVFDYTAEEVVKASSDQANEYYKSLITWIKRCEVVVFEVSYPSTSIGFEIALAVQHSKPIVAFHLTTAKQNLLLQGIQNERMQLIDYKPGELNLIVKDAIEYASEVQDTRFNFFISPKIAEHLDWVAKNRRLPRAVFLRKLIEDDMEQNQDYNER